MAVPNNVNVKPLNWDGLDANGQGEIKQARSPINQFLLNLYGKWNENKPQLFKDVPMLDVVTPQIAHVTGQGSALESMAGVGPARLSGGVQYGKYGRNAMNYGAQQGKTYASKQGQQFIKAQAENITRNPTKPGTGIPFKGAEIQTPILEGYSVKATPEMMGGMKPGSVEPVIPFSTRVRVAGIDAKNSVASAAGKAVSGTKAATSGAVNSAKGIVGNVASGIKGTANKHIGTPLKNFTGPLDTESKVVLGLGGLATAGFVGSVVNLVKELSKNSENSNPVVNNKPVVNKAPTTSKPVDPGVTKKPTTTKPVAKTDTTSTTKKPVPAVTKPGAPVAKPAPSVPNTQVKADTTKTVPVKPAAQTKPSTTAKTKSNTAVQPNTTVKAPAATINKPVVANTAPNNQAIPTTRIAQPQPVQEQAWNSDLQSAEHLAINAERNRLGGAQLQALKPLSASVPTQPAPGLAKAHPRVISPQVSSVQGIADNIFTKGRVMGFKRGGILKVKDNV